ncbi:molybdopterin molybdenumtransferase [Clostridium ragsdalei P11]|uniref:Molybdopterin molybdenumtransferase n=1 Tax=Clostridium ragsdalei P11 TaxID=1353534 RepID=A0A1A6AN65_9CLOT|nr:gephyrin-like molybdotransferase Glp [Clostridium ragsdalei]OBR91468.1 molybdopterin molybdenumtransferase [Clostridium ragsdalei P11]OBR91556.1 molybdopterin molybdenumtransferase [Clostridium ragsdalei P11]
MDFYKVSSVEEVKDTINSNFSISLGKELIDLKECNDRILYEDIVSPLNVPGFKRSIVDGYAVKCKEVQGASESMPSMLDLKGEVIMGKMPSKSLEFPGECMYIPTGGMLPEGADSVVMIEYTDKMDDTTILVNKPVAFGENVLNEDEDVELGETVLKAGTVLKPYSISMLSSLGIIKVPVICRPKVGIISTGDEIISPEEYPKPGQIRDINSYLLYSSVIEDGGEAIFYGVIRDDYEKLFETAKKANEECDVVLISGGSSVGKKDQTAKIIDELGKPGILLHGISIKPGKPTILGKVKNKPIFGLPGHPLSCAVVYRIIVRYFLQRMMKFEEVEYPIPCKFSTNYHKAKGREEYLPVTIKNIEGEYIAVPVLTKSAAISGFTKAWGYVKIDKNVEGIFKDQQVYVYKFQR